MGTQGQRFIEMLYRNKKPDLSKNRIRTALLVAEIHGQAVSEGYNPVTDPARMYDAFKGLEEQYEKHPLYSLSQDEAISVLIQLLDEYIHAPCDWSGIFSEFCEEVDMKWGFAPTSFVKPILEDRSLFRPESAPDAPDEGAGDHCHFTASDLLVVEALKFVPYINDYIRSRPEAEFDLTARDEVELKLLGRIFADCPNVRCFIPEKNAPDGKERKYGLVLAAPYIAFQCRSEFGSFASDTVALKDLLQLIAPGGTLVIAVGNSTAWRGGAIARLRGLIERNYHISAIAQGNDLYTLLIIDNTPPGPDKAVRLMDYTISSKGWHFENVDRVAQSTLADMGEWNLRRYRYISSDCAKEYSGSPVSKELFKAVADIFRGVTVRSEDISTVSTGESIPPDHVAIVEISNLQKPGLSIGKDCGYRFTEPTSIRLDEKKLPFNYLRKGDMLFSARGAEVKTSIVRDVEIPSVASANILVIRPYPGKMKSECLKVFFDSRYGREMLRGITYGHSLITISYKDLQNLEVPVPPIEVQERIARAYTNEYAFFSTMADIAKSRWNKAKQSLAEDLLSDGGSHWDDDSVPLLEGIMSVLGAHND